MTGSGHIILRDWKGRYLLLRNRKSRHWGYPGGQVDRNDQWSIGAAPRCGGAPTVTKVDSCDGRLNAALREFYEESGATFPHNLLTKAGIRVLRSDGNNWLFIAELKCGFRMVQGLYYDDYTYQHSRHGVKRGGEVRRGNRHGAECDRWAAVNFEELSCFNYHGDGGLRHGSYGVYYRALQLAESVKL